MSRLSRSAIQIIVAVVIGVFAIGILTSGGRLEVGWLRFYSAAVAAVSVLIALWDRFVWKLGWGQKLSFVPRDLNGTWRGKLTSFWVNPETGEAPDPKDAFLVIRQTSSHASVTLLTDESMSTSSLSHVSTEDGQSSLTYMYLNKPDNRVEHRSRMHHGSASLHITGRPVRRLRGRYWTDRDSRGELDFTLHSKVRAEDFESAQALFDAP